MTGSKRPGKGTAIIPFGYNVDQKKYNRVQRITGTPGVSSIPAVAGHTGALYHHFYNNPYNIIAIETLSKIFYPRCLKTSIRWRITTPDLQLHPDSDDNIILSVSPR
jgi:iron complex transport system substrate-binding protein